MSCILLIIVALENKEGWQTFCGFRVQWQTFSLLNLCSDFIFHKDFALVREHILLFTRLLSGCFKSWIFLECQGSRFWGYWVVCIIEGWGIMAEENTGYLQWTSTDCKSVLLLILGLEVLILEDDLFCYLFTFDWPSIFIILLLFAWDWGIGMGILLSVNRGIYC